jgi:hypothetical protein
MMLVGLPLAASATWTAIGAATWAEELPTILIGLSLVAAGYSLVARARRARRGNED